MGKQLRMLLFDVVFDGLAEDLDESAISIGAGFSADDLLHQVLARLVFDLGLLDEVYVIQDSPGRGVK